MGVSTDAGMGFGVGASVSVRVSLCVLVCARVRARVRAYVYMPSCSVAGTHARRECYSSKHSDNRLPAFVFFCWSGYHFQSFCKSCLCLILIVSPNFGTFHCRYTYLVERTDMVLHSRLVSLGAGFASARRLTLLELNNIMTSLLGKYDFELADEREVTYVISMILWVKGGLWVRAKPRGSPSREAPRN